MELREILTEAERQQFRAQHTGTMPAYRTALINVVRLLQAAVDAEEPEDEKPAPPPPPPKKAK